MDDTLLSGGKLAGGNPNNKRLENDFYATNPEAVKKLLDVYAFNEGTWLEPCVGAGHIASVVNKWYSTTCVGVDIVDRGYKNTITSNFIAYNPENKFSNIISNPPYSLAEEFIIKSLSMLSENGKMAMFLKIQFLEAEKRKKLFDTYPPKYIYVFRRRMATWNNGKPLDQNGKQWATTMCHAWFIWESGSNSEPVVRWL